MACCQLLEGPAATARCLPAGGTASGKTTVCDQIMQRLHDQCVVMLSQDSFYRGLTTAERADVQSEAPVCGLP